MFTIRQHRDDKDMLEIITRSEKGFITTLWAVVHEDFIHSVITNQDIKDSIIDSIIYGEEVEFKLVIT